MKFSCTKENLYRGLSVVSHVTAKNINLPILNNVLIKTENKVLKFISTNLEIAISCVVRGKIEEEGEFTAPAKLFADYISLLPNERVDCEINGDMLEIKCKSFETKIKGIQAVDFPLIPQIAKNTGYRIYAPDFKKAIEKVIFAASTNESRPEISGIFVGINPDGLDGKVIFAATDSYRLAEAQILLHGGKEQNKKEVLIVPARTMAEFLRILTVARDGVDGEDVAEIFIGENQILFSYNGIELSSRLVEGQYPDYRHIIPQAYTSTFEIPKDDLIKTVKMASLFTKTGLNDIKIQSFAERNEIEVSSTNGQMGENISKITVENQGPKNSIVLNYKYLIDGLNNIEGEKIRLKLIDDGSPCLIESVEENSGIKYIYIVMPIRV